MSQGSVSTSEKPMTWASRFWRHRAGRIVRASVFAYLLFLLLMMWLENLLIYPTWQIPDGDWSPAGVAFEDHNLTSDDGTRINAWYFEHPQPCAYVLYSHGNGENLAHLGEYMDDLRSAYKVSILAYDYRGYGRSGGKPQESGILADARAAQQWLAQRAGTPTDQVVLWGRSIGGAVSVQLATDLGARGLILERTFTSLPDVAAVHYPFLPVRWLMRNRYDSLGRIEEYQGPILQSHGTADEVVPFTLGEQLFAAAGSPRKQFVRMPGVTHNGPNSKDYYTVLCRFLTELP